jgi:hypothetical protein
MKFRAMVMAAALIAVCSIPRLATAQLSASSQSLGPIWVTVPAAAATLQKFQAKAPANGNMIITVTGTLVYEHTLGTQGWYCLALSQTPGNVGGCTPNAGSDSAVRGDIAAGEPTTVSGYGASVPYTIVRSWPVVAGTNYGFYVNGDATGFTGAYLFQPSITAVFVPATLAP